MCMGYTLGRLNVEKNLSIDNMRQDLVPKALEDDPYAINNDPYVLGKIKLIEEIATMSAKFTPWKVKAASLYAKGMSISSVGKLVKKNYPSTKACIHDLVIEKLIHAMQHLAIYDEVATEEMRKHALWRIAVDNEKSDPKEARGAITELNRMSKPLGGGSATPMTININNAVLPKGALDG